MICMGMDNLHSKVLQGVSVFSYEHGKATVLSMQLGICHGMTEEHSSATVTAASVAAVAAAIS